MTDTSIRPYRVAINQSALDDLDQRLQRALWPNELPGVGSAYGVSNERVRSLTEYWIREFDWREIEARLNAYPQFVTDIEGEDIHFLHVRSSRAYATPLVLTHGWPGSVLEYLDVIDPLTEPESPYAPAYHLVIASLPGFGFSGPTRSTGWNRYRTARAWAELMARLGYDSYGAIGNDAGSMISPELGRIDAEHVVGVHVTQLFSFPTGDPAEFVDLTPADTAALGHLQWFYDNKFSFNALHSQQPQRLAFALTDSPTGLLGWNSQLFGESLDANFIVANVALYWLTGTAGSAIRFCYEDAHTDEHPTGPTTAPTGLAMFAGDFQSIRRFAERDRANIVSWNAYDPGLPAGSPVDAGGHYPHTRHLSCSWPISDSSSCRAPIASIPRSLPRAELVPDVRSARTDRRTDLCHRSSDKPCYRETEPEMTRNENATRWDVLEYAHRALRNTISVLNSEDWTRRTPCEKWNVTQVLQHAAGDQRAYAAAITGLDGPSENPFEPSGRITGDPVELLERALDASASAWAGVPEDAAETPTPLPHGPLPTAVGVGACALDAAVHAWDIAVATGQPSPLTDSMAEQLMEVAIKIVEPLRAYGAYAAALTPVDTDGGAARLLRYLGRCPDWTA